MRIVNIFAYLIFKVMTTKDIISLVKGVRNDRGYTQKEMAEKLNISFQQYNHYETGRSEMTVSTFLRILEILDIGIKDFFQMEEGKITINDIQEMKDIISKMEEKLM